MNDVVFPGLGVSRGQAVIRIGMIIKGVSHRRGQVWALPPGI